MENNDNEIIDKSKKEDIYTELTEEEKYRYNRQTKLSEFGEKGQLKLKNAKVVVIGAGGLGSSCLMHLAGSGVGKICIIDNDVVDEQNLHRQIIHNINNIGVNKALSAKKFMNLLNPNIEVIALNESFTNKNGLYLCKGYDIIIDCCDNPKTRFICNDVAVLLNKTFISAASVRWDGQIGVYVKNCKGEKLPCYRCLNPKAPIKENVKKCAQVGVIGTLPSIMGTLEANEAIKFILGKDEQILQRKIIIFDGYDNRIKIMKTRNYQDDCIVCGKNKILNKDNINEYDYDSFINGKI
jgi:adenylyltransferase/sulfurtransferase